MTNALNFQPVLDNLDLVSLTVAGCVQAWKGQIPVDQLWVAEIDPGAAGGSEFCTRYGFRNNEGANCVIVQGQRGTNVNMAAVVIPVGCKSDFNSAVRKRLGARQVSLAPIDAVLKATRMEYGSITPIGLPSTWVILVDSVVADAPRVVIGSGLVRSKLSVPGAALLDLPGAQRVEGLARPNN